MKNNSSKREVVSNNLIQNIKRFLNDNSVLLGEKRTEILLKYFGINKDVHTLKEIGSYYNNSKERIRQIKEDSLNDLLNIFLGEKNEKGKFICSLEFLNQMSDLRILLLTHSVITQDRLYTKLNPSDRYKISNRDKPYINLLLAVFGYEEFDLSDHFLYFDRRKFNKQSLSLLFKTLHKILNKSIYPLDVSAILVEVKKEIGNYRLAYKDIENFLEQINEVESISENGKKYFQLRFDALSTIAAMGIRILNENKQPMHFKEVIKGINEKLKQLNSDRTILYESLIGEFVKSSFTKANAKSGYWTLKEWNSDYQSICSLVETALIETKKPLSLDEIYRHITTKRPGIKIKSMRSIMAVAKNKYLRLENRKYILKAWEEKYKNLLYTKKIYNDLEIMKQIVKIYKVNSARSLYTTSLKQALEKVGINFPRTTYNAKILKYPILERAASYSREILLKDDYEIALSKII